MNELETHIKEMIIDGYGSMKNFCEVIDMPWTTLDSILKRGFMNSNIGNVLKITKELKISSESLARGQIESAAVSSSSENISQQARNVLDLYDRLDEVGKAQLAAYAEGLLASQGYDNRYSSMTQADLIADAEAEVDRIVKEELKNADKKVFNIQGLK